MAFAQDYEIKIVRPVKPGQKFSTTVAGSTKQSQTVKVNGQVAQQDLRAFTVDLEADGVILTVTEKNLPKTFEYTVRKFTRTDAGKTTELLPAGKTIVVDRDKEKVPPFSLKDGGELAQNAMEALDVVIAEDKKDSIDDELVFGTRERKAVGAEWPMNAELAASGMTQRGVKIAKENLSGTVKLNGVEQANGMECLNMTMTVDARNIEVPMPQGFKIEQGTMKALAVGLLPVDPTLPKQSSSTQMKMTVVAKNSQPDKEVVVEVLVDRSMTEKRVYK
jgi:hypothetical protein